MTRSRRYPRRPTRFRSHAEPAKSLRVEGGRSRNEEIVVLQNGIETWWRYAVGLDAIGHGWVVESVAS